MEEKHRTNKTQKTTHLPLRLDVLETAEKLFILLKEFPVLRMMENG